MNKLQWKGVFPALTTKFTADDELDIPLFRHNIAAQLSAGVDGLIIGGSLGEASTITGSEKQMLVEAAQEEAGGRIPIVLNIAEGSTREAIAQVRMAEKCNVEGLMLLPPMRYKSDEKETLTYFTTIAASTDLPIMVYNNPVDYRIEVTGAMFEELAMYPNIHAVKESTRDVSNVTRMINRFGTRFRILCGVDTLAMEELVMGADGWVAGLVNAFPQETVAIYQLVRQQRYDEARRIFRWFLPVLELDIHPKLVQYIKLAEAVVGLGSEYVRAPRLVLQGLEREEVLAIIQDAVHARPLMPSLNDVREKV